MPPACPLVVGLGRQEGPPQQEDKCKAVLNCRRCNSFSEHSDHGLVHAEAFQDTLAKCPGGEQPSSAPCELCHRAPKVLVPIIPKLAWSGALCTKLKPYVHLGFGPPSQGSSVALDKATY